MIPNIKIQDKVLPSESEDKSRKSSINEVEANKSKAPEKSEKKNIFNLPLNTKQKNDELTNFKNLAMKKELSDIPEDKNEDASNNRKEVEESKNKKFEAKEVKNLSSVNNIDPSKIDISKGKEEDKYKRDSLKTSYHEDSSQDKEDEEKKDKVSPNFQANILAQAKK